MRSKINIAVYTGVMLSCLTTKAQVFASFTAPSRLESEANQKEKYENPIQFSVPEDLIQPEMLRIKLQNSINSRSAEMGPLVSPDGKTIYFSRSYPLENHDSEDYDEDIWFAEWDDAVKNWREAKKLKGPLNNGYPNYINSISSDGKTILLGNSYLISGKMKNGLSMSHLKNNKWSFPEKLKIKGAKKCFNWAGSYLSESGNVLIISCQQKNHNLGGQDLYVCMKNPDNTWSNPINMGVIINSNGKETSPFLSSDEKTIFYTSDRLGGFGGTDIFMSTRLDDSWIHWSAPQNMGGSINTSDDESFFSISPFDGKIYYSSRSESSGDFDILCLENSGNSEANVKLKTAFLGFDSLESVKARKFREANTPVIIVSPIYFDINQFRIDSVDKQELEKIKRLAHDDASLIIEVTGHTDNLGSRAYNGCLSLLRAKAVARFFIERGIAKERILIRYKGPDKPISDNHTKQGRSLNRRVEFKLVTPTK